MRFHFSQQLVRFEPHKPLNQVYIFVLTYLSFYHAPMSIMIIIRLVSCQANDPFFPALRTTAGSIERYYSSLALELISAYLVLSGLHYLALPYLKSCKMATLVTDSPCQHRCRVYFLVHNNIRGLHSSDLCLDTVKDLKSKPFRR